ncbi:cytosolic purine 5'-nucleotidase-like protein [Trifolium pratense]|uniref:Cytosolic purine 5'-nucleotidase-like protein n=1 Tax=Trifolium pratense TaxID=57577 RepID=A0A2K3NM98_TRIPR|nr:cytosolic purine 5'-nucleotidase-like protein [Trifolium pratense]
MPFSRSIPIPTSISSPEPRAHYLNLTLHYDKFKPFHSVSLSLRNRIPSRIFSDAHSPSFLSFSPPPHSSSSVAGDSQLKAQFSRDEIRIDACGESSEHLREWLSFPDYGPKTDIGMRIFCNRPLNMKNIVAVGFDMDYTLAQYRPETFESLAYQHTVKKLVYDLKYPSELLSWSFDPNYMVRGLVLDKKRGNILKMDCHKYVKVAYHGFKELSKEDKFVTYGNTLVCDPFDGPDYALIDTLFSLAEAYLFAQLVDFKDRNPGKLPMSIDYACLYKDVRHAVDLCHRDGTLKQQVAKDPGRSSGVNDSTNLDWLQYFDVIITGSAKPSFFLEGNHANLFEVEPESGKLLNTDNGSPMPQVGNISAGLLMKEKDRKVFQVLYVGDHIYGDILRSKKVLGWRTMLVIPELEREVQVLSELRDFRKDLQILRSKDDCIADKMHHLNRSLKLENPDDHTKQKLNSKLDELKLEREIVLSSHQEALRKLHQKFHEPWGQLMKTGYQNSRFAHQVERFACLYTSQVSNLGLLSLDKYYRPSEDFMQHEFGILES